MMTFFPPARSHKFPARNCLRPVTPCPLKHDDRSFDQSLVFSSHHAKLGAPTLSFHFEISSRPSVTSPSDRDHPSAMPNTGRFYAPAAAASYRERYMRPYSTVSPPIGGHSVLPAPFGRPTTSRRQEPEAFSPGYESRVRTRPTGTLDRHVEDERKWTSGFIDKQPVRQRAWIDQEHEESVHRGNALASIGSVRGDVTRLQTSVPPTSVYSTMGCDMTQRQFELPSTLPRLSSLLKRSPSDPESFDSQDRLTSRKRARELSPQALGLSQPSKVGRFSVEEGGLSPPHDVPSTSHRSFQLHDSQALIALSQANPQRPRRHVESTPVSETLYDERHISSQERPTSHYSDGVRRLNGSLSGSSRVNDYEDEARAYQIRNNDFCSSDAQHSKSSLGALSSPPPSSNFCDELSPARRYSESKEADSVIEAAADLVEERSPSKRESITKLLLKSKEFLKAKSLVRNRNNEIDWVATFLNVGFESNSIYSLMCPLRKGRWKVEEERYTMELLRLIECGVIRLRHGQSIRGFIAKKLHSDDMRVLKKLSNCKMFHFARLINPRMSEEEEIDESLPNVRASLDRLDKLKAEFLRSVQLEALVAVRKYLSDTSIRDLLNARD